MKIPDDVVVGTAVEGEDAEIRFDPVDSVVALRIAGQIPPVIVHKGASVLVLGHSVTIVRFLVGARHKTSPESDSFPPPRANAVPSGRNTTSGISP